MRTRSGKGKETENGNHIVEEAPASAGDGNAEATASVEVCP